MIANTFLYYMGGKSYEKKHIHPIVFQNVLLTLYKIRG